MQQWARTASDRDIQVQLLCVATQTRDELDAIQGILVFMIILWLLGAVALIAARSVRDDCGVGRPFALFLEVGSGGILGPCP